MPELISRMNFFFFYLMILHDGRCTSTFAQFDLVITINEKSDLSVHTHLTRQNDIKFFILVSLYEFVRTSSKLPRIESFIILCDADAQTQIL